MHRVRPEGAQIPSGRLHEILELVTVQGSVTISQVSESFGVSSATARRALNDLADQRLVARTHGGAVSLGAGLELPLQYKVARSADRKLAIAAIVPRFVPPGSTVGLGGGTTTTEVARELSRSERYLAAHDGIGLTIVTNALNIGYELAVRSHIRTVITGGVARSQSYELVGPLVRKGLDGVALDVAIIGVAGVSAQFGATSLHGDDAEVASEFARGAARVIVVADESKMNRVTFARTLALDEVDVLVTDVAPTGPVLEALRAASVEIVVA